KFLKRINVWIDDRDPKDRAVVFRSVEQEPVRRKLLAIDVDLITALRILSLRVLPIAVQLRSWSYQQHLRHIPVQNRKAAKFLRCEGGADVGAVHFQERSLAG